MSSNHHLEVAIVTPDGEVYQDSQVNVVIAPAALGEVSILPNHAPFFTKLSAGEVRIKASGQSHNFAVFGGFMDVSPEGGVTILADFAQRSHEIDLENAQKAKTEAEKLMREKQKFSKEEYARIETALRQALFTIKMAEKAKKRKSI